VGRSVKNLRQVVSELMVRVHRISPELADYHVRKMGPSEVKQRFLYYVRLRIAGAELSVAAQKSERSPCLPPGCSRPQRLKHARGTQPFSRNIDGGKADPSHA